MPALRPRGRSCAPSSAPPIRRSDSDSHSPRAAKTTRTESATSADFLMSGIIPHLHGAGNRSPNTAKIPNEGRLSASPPAAPHLECGLPPNVRRHGVAEAIRPLPPVRRGGIKRLGKGYGTPLPVAVQATRWNRRMRNLPTSTRGTDARPKTSSARKRSFAHISCVGLRHPSERRESTPVSKTCHRA